MDNHSSAVVDLAEYRAQRAAKTADTPEYQGRPRAFAPRTLRNAAHRERMLRHLRDTANRAEEVAVSGC
jgi:hypothetical protein